MTLGKFAGRFITDLLVACGFLLVASTLILALNSKETVSLSLLWQLLLAAGARTFFKYGLINTEGLRPKAQFWAFCIFMLLADTMILLWLCFFSPNPLGKELMLPFILTFVVVKAVVYPFMYMDGKREAEELNQKLKVYKNADPESKE